MTYSELEFKHSKMLMSNIRNVFHPFEFIIVEFSALLKLLNDDSIKSFDHPKVPSVSNSDSLVKKSTSSPLHIVLKLFNF